MSAIRFIQFDRDADTGARSVLDIREMPAPAAMEERVSYTAMSKDAVRRALLVDLARQIEQLVSGEIDEINIVLAPEQ